MNGRTVESARRTVNSGSSKFESERIGESLLIPGRDGRKGWTLHR
ncbi:MAG: hypothetical protein AVDCRST_MAG31-2619 [uncultured Sphingomonas sp.]|uniref:Uncharacterized protein n=1 Tax=uncultured Sphingomonas sp. TaxID=158754 RepID=A0A6J4TWR9_9SPHN|nr:MAG: hypothetical protein AVDCRST_MAG31-2619 [uncultured Sphingomonas sp.]